ncbi:MAG: efflux RND transporter periplasmic adaptor subunit [Planctomycetota bacterium]|jgi:RND family efflux transporter MFP subunit
MTSRRSRVWWLTTLLLLTLPGCRPPPEAPEAIRPVRTFRVGDATQLVGRRFPGRARATNEVNLAFRVSGPLITRAADVGNEVSVGEILATIDPRDFDVAIRNVTAQLAEAAAARDLAVEEFERADVAHKRGALTDIELVRRRESRNRALANVDALQAALDQANDARADTELKAPFAGTVVAVYVENFEEVLAKQPIVRILDDTHIEMIVDIPEHLIPGADPDLEVLCTFDALPGVELEGTIKEIGKEASETTRTYPVTLEMDQPEGARVLPGMTGEARAKRPPVDAGPVSAEGYEIPGEAVAAADDGTSYVWVIDEEAFTVSRRTVTLGAMSQQGIRVTDLEPGLLIAAAGVHYLREGQRVRVLEETVR